jgi:ATP-dependent Clp protease ATP-binding subunit ClpA
MGARPMARVIQERIKTPLADELLFGRLKNGGTVRVMVVADETGKKTLGFLYPEGPVLPRPERDLLEAGKKRARAKDGEEANAEEGDAEPAEAGK